MSLHRVSNENAWMKVINKEAERKNLTLTLRLELSDEMNQLCAIENTCYHVEWHVITRQRYLLVFSYKHSVYEIRFQQDGILPWTFDMARLLILETEFRYTNIVVDTHRDAQELWNIVQAFQHALTHHPALRLYLATGEWEMSSHEEIYETFQKKVTVMEP